MMFRTITASVFAVALALCAGACSNDSATSASTVSSLSVTGTVPAVGATSQFTAIATLASGSTQDVTSAATWSSSNLSAAAVSASGLVTAAGSGTAVISATYSNVVGSDSITVP